MFGPTFSDYYREKIKKVQQDILHESDAQILGSNVDELANYYFQKYALQPLVFDSNDISYEIKKEVRRVPADQREGFYRYDGDIDWEYEVAVISIPIQPNPNLEVIKELRSLDGFEKDIVYQQGEISYSFDIKWYGGSMSEDQIASEINRKSQRLLETLNQKNSAINSENQKFLNDIKDLIIQRKAKLNSGQEKIKSLVQKIKIPLKQKVVPDTTKVHVDAKKFVQLIKPTPRLPEEYFLEESILKEILEYVDNQCKSFERTPSSYTQLEEEQLRDIISSALNAIFEGDATSETFIKKGKTDIHLKIKKGEILVFECKIWRGEKLYLKTIDQLIGYVTWRQNYGVLIIFCKNKDFSKILAQLPNIIQHHKLYVRGYKKLSNTHFVSEHSLPEDTEKIIKIHHLIYNLYSE